MTWVRTHWVAIAVSAVLFFVGVAVGTTGQNTKTTTVRELPVAVNRATITAEWTVTLESAPGKTIPGTGTFLVGEEVTPGTYRAAAHKGCYWERDRDLKGGLNSIIQNDNTDGPVVLLVQRTDKAIKTARCAPFYRSG
jgi:hypothetical protein